MCPRCGATAGNGFIEIKGKDVKLTLFFVRLLVKLDAMYCPNCGLLKIKVSGINIEDLTK